MIKNLIFDIGGVLIENPSMGMFAHFEKALGVSREILIPALTNHWKDWERGVTSEEELWQRVGKDLGRKLTPGPSLWLDGFIPGYKVKAEMFELIHHLKQSGYIIAALSNIEKPIKDFIVSQNYEDIDMFIFSCEVNMSKPNPDIYEHALTLLHADPQETIFVDDKKENIETANKLGMHGIHFTDHATLLEQFSKFGV